MKVMFGLVLACLLPATALAQVVNEGEEIARRWCSTCHQVEPQPRRESDAIPSFSAIAQMPSTTETSLMVFLSSTHGGMPDYSLSRTEIRNVSAYILSLKTLPQTGR